MTACGSGSASPTAAGGGGQAFYQGKAIVISVDKPGSTRNSLATALQPLLAQYLHANVTLQVSNSSTISANAGASAVPDGLTMGIVNMASVFSALYTNNYNYSFQPLGLEYLGAVYAAPDLFVSCLNSSIKSAEDLINTKSTVSYLDAVGTTSDFTTRVLFAAYNIPNKRIGGYTSNSQPAGCQRGDGDLSQNAPSYFTTSDSSAMIPGETPLFVDAGVIPSGSDLAWLNKQVPTLNTFVDRHTPPNATAGKALQAANDVFGTVGNMFYFPAGTPQARVTTMEAALQWAIKQPSFEKELLTLGIANGYIAPNVINKDVAAGVSQQSLFGAYVTGS
jgi:tripartite-type tricarboxylate transporter receptor subunit TctC